VAFDREVPAADKAVTSYDRWLVWKHGARMRDRQRALDLSDSIAPTDRDWGDQTLVETSARLIEPFAVHVVSAFYDELFARLPSIRALFPTNMATQRDRLLAALLALAAGGADPGRLEPVLQQLGRDHRKFGARAVQYKAVGEALIVALARFTGPDWTPAMEAAWRARYGAAADVMIQAAESDQYRPPYWYATLVELTRYGPDVAILHLQPHEPYDYIAGQYATIESPRLPRVWRAYSMATTPQQDKPLEFHVRATGRGGLSDTLLASTVGDTVRLGPPQGTNTLATALERPKLFVAGGTGWSTIKALLDQIAVTSTSYGSSRLIMSCRPGEPYDPAFDELAHELPDLRTTLVHNSQHLDAELRPERLLGLDLDAHLSGPPAMVDRTLQLLSTAGVPVEHIHHDDLPH
jgi:ferredoxin-NADP reductase/hemoglobin-like flavoprotein